jgi:hypothetical protein
MCAECGRVTISLSAKPSIREEMNAAARDSLSLFGNGSFIFAFTRLAKATPVHTGPGSGNDAQRGGDEDAHLLTVSTPRSGDHRV